MAQEPLKKALRISYAVSLGVSLLLGGGFWLVTTLAGDYNTMARYGGAAWVFLLSLIIALPTVTPIIKRRYRG